MNSKALVNAMIIKELANNYDNDCPIESILFMALGDVVILFHKLLDKKQQNGGVKNGAELALILSRSLIQIASEIETVVNDYENGKENDK